MTYRKKLIEVALPLNIINKEVVHEKLIRSGHPATFHLWWSRKPLATSKAVLFASFIDDPSSRPEEFPTEKAQEQERQRIFELIGELVKWENSIKDVLVKKVFDEITKSTIGEPPIVFDPFCGSGAIPYAAQGLGLKSYGSDINPVAVLISKALIEIPPKFAGRVHVNPNSENAFLTSDLSKAYGLAQDIRYYGQWMYKEAKQRIGHLYPSVNLPKEYGWGTANVVAWLWVRAITCQNPACGTQMPLTSKWWLSKKKGREAWVEPSIDYSTVPCTINFIVKTGKGQPSIGTVNRQGATCIACGTSVPLDYIRNEGKSGRIDTRLIATVAEGQKRRIYLSPDESQILAAKSIAPDDILDTYLPDQALGFRVQIYGMVKHSDLFTPRQLMALSTFSELVSNVHNQVLTDAINAGLPDDDIPLEEGGKGAKAYADAIATYLAIAVDRGADYWSSICSWNAIEDNVRDTFARQAIPMVWDFAEANPFGVSTGNFQNAIEGIAKVVETSHSNVSGRINQHNATEATNDVEKLVISTDPPYYDNIGYADLSDFFYVWLRRPLNKIYSRLFGTMLVPKSQELIASPFRFQGDKNKAQHFFEEGLEKAFKQMRAVQHPEYPLTIYYAFKQSESEVRDDEKNGVAFTASTGWETMLEGLINAGFTITGTWPMRTERMGRSVENGTNALASSIVIVCRPRPLDAPISYRRQFLNALRLELPLALKQMQHGSIAPVDLAQASIGPGMAIYSRYSKVVESDGSTLSVRTALQLINRALDEVLAEQEGEYDVETRWAVAWFEEYAMEEGPYGRAETLSKAKNMDVQKLVEAGLLEAKAGKVRLLKRDELSTKWKPMEHSNLTVWEAAQRMIFALDKHGEDGAATVLSQFGEQAEIARDLAYRLYTVCERKGWSQEALAYNSLVISWSEVSKVALKQASDGNLMQPTLLGEI